MNWCQGERKKKKMENERMKKGKGRLMGRGEGDARLGEGWDVGSN